MKQTIGINEFVKRQILGSGKTYTVSLTLEDICLHAQSQMAKNRYKKGYRDGVIIVEVANSKISHFICPLVKISKSTNLIAKIVKRKPSESPYIQIRALNGNPLKTGKVDLILYRNDVLKETNENSTDCHWELISFHAYPKDIPSLPMGPITMMRNQLQLPGGTRGVYSSSEWANSVRFWQEYVILIT